MMRRTESQAEIAAYIATRGVTHCPVAAVAYTSGVIPDAARLALRTRRRTELMTIQEVKHWREKAAAERDPVLKAALLEDIRRLYRRPREAAKAGHMKGVLVIRRLLATGYAAMPAAPAPGVITPPRRRHRRKLVPVPTTRARRLFGVVSCTMQGIDHPAETGQPASRPADLTPRATAFLRYLVATP